MKVRGGEQTERVTLPAFCTVAVLAEMGDVTRYMMKRVLRGSGVQRVGHGRTIPVPVAETKEKMSLPFRSLQLVESERRARHEGKSAK